MQITSMAISISEDKIFFVTKSNQLLRAEIPIYDPSAESDYKIEFVHNCQFHTEEITGLDTCIRKQLIATCSKDRTVKVWNYAKKELEISFLVNEDALALAFHPSGFHLIVALQDKI